MANTSLIEQEVLHEIAMSIGISLDLGDMLRECLPIFVRGLGCCTAAVLLQDGECGFFTPKCILPHAAMRNRGLHQAMAKAIDLHSSGQAFAIPLMEQAEQHLYYAWRLKETGILLLGRSNAFAYPLYMEVGPLVDKLAFAIQACEQYDSLRIAKQAMAKARDEAESANKAKSYFLATMSHEIRTPLNAVLNLSELLAETQLSDQQHRLLNGICSGGQALLQLVNDVLDFSKIEAGKLEFTPEPFHLGSLLDGVRDLYGKQATEKGLSFEFKLDPQLPEVIETDPSRLRQILHNLLSNALKFTDHGFIRVTVTPEPLAPGAQQLRFMVEDSGIGIAEEHQAGLFQEFHQLDSGLNRRFGGTGLGLAIVARLVDGMKGSLGMSSCLGEGSRFWFVLPVLTSRTLTAPQSLPLPTAGGNILLVEDSPTNQMVACALLEKLGCQVTVAESGAQAIAAVQHQMFDLVLMDISMPGMDGMEATQRIRQLGADYVQLPIVAMTAHALAQDRASCLAAGMNDYLSKPLQRERLQEVVSRWLASAPLAVHPAPESPPLWITYPILELSILDGLQQETTPQVLLQVVELFIQEVGVHGKALDSALNTMDLQAAVAPAHAIKSSAGALGAMALFHAASALESACRLAHAETAAPLLRDITPLIQQTVTRLQQHFQPVC